MNRWGPLAILVIAAVAAAIGVLTSADHEKHGPAQLVIHERALKSNETFTEGAVGFLTVRRTSDDDVVFHGRYGYRLAPGRGDRHPTD